MTAQVRTDTRLPAPLSMRSRLRLSCGLAALAAAAAVATPQQAKAQAFQGNETVVAGIANRTITSTTSETITVGSPTATINWSPYDTQGTGTVNFLPSGHTATFTNNPNSTADFTVLNRIIPLDTSRPISLNGHVISQLQDLSGNVTRGGNVWFYSPGGIMIGATAVFDVGGLLLSVNDAISFSTSAGGFTGRFARSDSNAQVNIASGAQINALANNSYVALVAPRVEQHGSIRVDGAAALVAGQDVSLTMNQGLFDIQVNVGTDDPNGVVHTGSTGGPSSSGPGDNHRVYMVAVPKNNALTMLLSGDVGFDAASSATVENGQIRLWAGWQPMDADGTATSFRSASGQASIKIGPGSYSSKLTALAAGDIFAVADAGSISFAEDVVLSLQLAPGSGRVHLGATNGNSLTVGGSATLQTWRSETSSEASIFANSGGIVNIAGSAHIGARGAHDDSAPIAGMHVDGGSITVGGSTSVDASDGFSSGHGGTAGVTAANGGSIETGSLHVNATGLGVPANAIGGTVNISSASGSTITVNGDLTAVADGRGVSATTGSTAGGVGTGGTVNLTADSGAVTVAGTTTLTADGTGGSPAEGATGTQAGGAGIGGRVQALVQGTGQLTLQNTLRATAHGIGGSGLGGGADGNGTGGFVGLYARDGGTATIHSASLKADGTGGESDGGDGGDGTGGTAEIISSGTGSTIGIANEAPFLSGQGFPDLLSATGSGGQNNGGGDLTGGTGTGGRATVRAEAGGSITLPANPATTGLNRIIARGFGGNAAAEGGRGGDAYGGTIDIGTDGGTITAGPLLASAFTAGGSSVSATSNITGGGAFGGNSHIYARNGGVLNVSLAGGGAGGMGGNGSGSGNGGDASGGVASLTIDGGTANLAGFNWVSAIQSGGSGAIGGDATGGTATVLVTNGGALNATSATDVGSSLGVSAGAWGGDGTGRGGTARAGVAQIIVDPTGSASTLSIDSVSVFARGVGGSILSGGSGTAGDGFGGQARVTGMGANNSLTFGSLDVSAAAIGGVAYDGGVALTGGNGTGGLAQVYVEDATLTFGSATISTSGTGGNGNVGGRGVGGSAPAGDSTAPSAGAFVSVRNGSIFGTDLIVSSTGTGGAGSAGAGGHGIGGLASVTALNGTSTGLIDVDNVTVDASAAGGAGGAGAGGGIGQGGQAYLLARALNGALAVNAATIRATGTGGAGGAGVSGGAGGAGGLGYGGWTNFGTSSGQMSSTDREGIATFGTVDADVSGVGGAGGAGDASGAGGAGGVGIGGGATMLARGSRVNAQSVGIAANGTGGLGGLDGSGAVRAAAGTGIGGGAGLLATNIFQGTDPSTVVVGSLTASASGIAADSSAATQAGAVRIEVVNSSAQLGTVAMTAAGAGPRNFTGTGAFGNSFTLTPLSSGILADNATIHVTGSGQITSGHDIEVSANAGGLLDVDGNLTLASGGGMSVLTVDSGRIAVGGTLSATTLPSASGRGGIYMATTSSTNQPPSQPGIHVGALSLTSALDVDLQGILADGAANIVYAGSAELGNLTADSVRLRLAAVPAPNDAHSLEITGLVSARTISLESSDLVFGSSGQLGQAGLTTSLELIARSFGQPIVIGDGGPVAAGQYHLSQADAQRIEAAAITFRATSATAQSPQVVVRDLTIQGSAGGGTSSVRLITPGSVRVEGDLAYIDAAASDALTITAAERLEVITPDGSIRMLAPDGGLAGVLTLQSSNIVVTDAALAAQLAEDPNFAGRNEALETNNGPVNQAGYVEADGIQLLTSGNIFIQNSGTATEFAGLTVGGQGLLVGRYQASTNPDGTQSFSFVGTLTTADDVLLFDFTITSQTQITLRTYSYAGGVNGAGQTIPAGGFDPILALFDAAGTLIGQNDDGGSDNVPADPTTGRHYDTFLQAMLPAGTYTVAVTAFSNFPAGTNLSDGFRGGGNFNGRTPNFAFDVMGADVASGPGDTGPITVVAFGRMQNADGSFTTGNSFFAATDFGLDSGVQYAEGSTFNGCAIGGSCLVAQAPTQNVPPPGTNPQTVFGPVALIDTGPAADPEDESDASGIGISTSTSLIDTGPGVLEGLLDEAVTSGGDTAQWIEDEEDEDEDCEPGDERQQCQERTN